MKEKPVESKAPRWQSAFVSICLLLMLVHLGDSSNASAQQSGASDEQKLIEKIRDAVIKELREGDFFQQQVELGIQNYIKKQENTQAEARAESERLANEKAKNVRRVSPARDHIFGDPKAAVSLIEYSDYECPFCKRFHSTAQQIIDSYPGQVNWVYRHFPLEMHNPGAQKQAEAAECVAQIAGNDAFWKFTHAIYQRTLSNGKGFPLTQLVPLAKEIGVNDNGLQECIDSGKFAPRVQEDLAEGSQIGVTGTPASFLIQNATGEVILKVGAQPFDSFKPDIDRLLQKNTAANPTKKP